MKEHLLCLKHLEARDPTTHVAFVGAVAAAALGTCPVICMTPHLSYIITSVNVHVGSWDRTNFSICLFSSLHVGIIGDHYWLNEIISICKVYFLII